MQSALYGLVAPNAAVIVVAGTGLALVALVAGFVPARRAAGQDPWQALRTE